MRISLVVLGVLAGCAHAGRPPLAELPPVAANALRPPEAFARITRKDDRSRALFLEATRVMLHPRCANCHPAGDTPAQGDRGLAHDPPVTRGPDDHGVAGLRCDGCHQDRNLEAARVPGAPGWHLAPLAMAWISRTPRALCEQIKDPARNGGKTIAQIVEHSGHDELVAWGWAPGHGRAPAPGTQAEFGRLMAAWAEAGAVCPQESRR